MLKQWFETHWLKPAAVAPSEATFATPAAPWIEMTRGDLLPRQNGRDGKPLKLGDTVYHRGLACAPHNSLVVHLPGPGRSFSAVTGVDSLESRPGGKGMMSFLVHVGDQARFSSGNLEESSAPQHASVALDGAAEFTLTALNEGGGDGNRDYADWADAKVTLEDGRELWLGEMPMQDRRSLPQMAAARTTLASLLLLLRRHVFR